MNDSGDDDMEVVGVLENGVPVRRPAQRPEPGSQAGAISAEGQLVVVIARWVLVLAGFGLAIWNPAPIGELRLQIGLLLALAVANFYLHAQLLRRQPVVDGVAYGASAADLCVLTALILAQKGYESHLYVFYCVALLALSVAFPAGVTALFTGITAGVYAFIAMATLPRGAGDAEALTVFCRVLMLVAVAVCGQVYLHIERRQAAERARLGAAARDRQGGQSGQGGVGSALEAAQDLFFGQVVLIWARWAVILGGAAMALWLSETPESLTLNVLPVVVLMGINFYLHARYLLEKPANALLVKALSVVDLLAICTLVLTWAEHPGLESPFYIYAYPVVLAFAFVFPPRLTVAFTGLALATYAAICIAVDPALVMRGSDLKLLTVRLVTLGAMGGLGTFYWRTQRARLRARGAAPNAPGASGTPGTPGDPSPPHGDEPGGQGWMGETPPPPVQPASGAAAPSPA